MKTGRLIIISGPSGAGKSSVIRKLIQNCSLPLQLSISATTRPPRSGEIHGRDYHFLSPSEFNDLRSQDAFLEFKEVFGRGHWYGTLREPVIAGLNAGKWIILEIDVQGALSVLEKHPDTVSLFVHPGSLEELETRLRNRGSEKEDEIQRRLEVARTEMASRGHYQYEIINHSLDETVQTICDLLSQLDGEH